MTLPRWLLIVAVPVALGLLALALGVVGVDRCPGVPDQARLFIYDNPLDDLFTGPVPYDLESVVCECRKTFPDSPRPGFTEVGYECPAFKGRGTSGFMATIVGGSPASKAEIQTWVANASEIRGPLVLHVSDPSN